MQSSKMRIGQSIMFVLMAMAGSLASALLVDTLPASALYTNAQIEQRLRNGIATAHSWDNACRDTLSQSPSSSFNGNLRALINGDVVATDASYSQGTWFSERNQPNVSSPITVISGTTSINLQLNSVQFICGPLVNPNVTTDSFTAQQLLNQSQRWVTATNARDRNPNPVGNVRTLPAKTGVSYRYSNLTITVGGGNVAWDGGTGPTRNLLITRDNNSRYWFAAPVNVRYNDPSGITSNRTITIRANYNTISTYNNSVHRCTAPAGGAISVGSATAFGSCREYTATYTLMINVTSPPPDYNHVPSMASLPVSVVAGASINNVSATVQNTGSQASPASTVWRITRFVVPAGQTLADNPAYVAGDPACSRFINHDSCSNPVGDTARSFAANSTMTGLGTYNDATMGVAAGSSICYVASVLRASSTVPSRRFSAPRCVTLQHSPDLEPRTDGPSGVITPGQSAVPVTSRVVSAGTANPDETRAGTARFVVRNGNSLDRTVAGTANTAASTGFTCRIVNTTVASASSQCDMETEQTYASGSITGTQTLWNGDWDISDISSSLQFGDQVCFITVVNRYNTTAGDEDWRHSAPACIVVAKVPSIQVSGGDLAVRVTTGAGTDRVIRGVSYAGAGVLPSERIRYGSWAEYGVFGPSSVDIHSGGALAHATTDVPVADKNYLTFANLGTSTPGQFTIGGAATLPNFAQLNIPTRNAGATYSGAIDPAMRERDNQYSGNVTLDMSENLTGTYVIRSAGTVTINGDIRYAPGPYTSLAALPQVIIIARNINIDASVINIDAWLIATEAINTCGSGTPTNYYDGLNSDTCNSKLRINGVVQTGRLLLRRTAGAEGPDPQARHQPAEVFNGRSDAYLWQYGRAAAQSIIRTEGVRELPPRF